MTTDQVLEIVQNAREHGAVPNLRDASLAYASLYGANLSRADLRDANLTGANLRDADMAYANLRDADLTGASLADADLFGVDLYGANLTGADLTGASLAYANLYGANLTGADLAGAKLAYANLGEWTVLCIGPIGSRGAYLTYKARPGFEEVMTGCFRGTLAQFEARVRETHGNNQYGQEYAAAIACIKGLRDMPLRARVHRATRTWVSKNKEEQRDDR